ncbi:SWIM-type domain-containing protein [Heracleum sosnowskyi]|uniref:SWIM-type domain-containing protein n=1 Tax=Heracleum sosnowskyi TaxID=360622 RepID=A0AAD8IBB7_9APIA|nr:SWIM-type domain-containing protein [Heracleum sosnowskyi]
MASSNVNYVWGWLYFGGNIIHDSVIGSAYDRDVIASVKLHFDLKYEELLNVVHKKLNIDPNLGRLRVSRRFMNPTTNKYAVVLLVDDDDLEYMFETLDCSCGKVRVELYIEKILIGLSEISTESAKCSKIGEDCEISSSTRSLKSVYWGSVSSGSSSRNLFVSSADTEGNSRESNELTDGDIPFYRSFDGSSMVVSDLEHGMQKIGELQNPTDLTKGMTFESKEKLLSVVKQNTEGCHWRLRARKRKLRDYFEIMDTKGPHTCVNQAISQDHRNLSSSHIAEIIMNLVAVDPTVSEKVLEAAVVKEVGYKPSSKKLRDGKKIASQKVYGSWEQSYQDLPLLMNVIQKVNHGMHVDWYFKEHGLREPILKVVRFKRLFWTFKPCVDAFKHCIPVLQIDGTHLYGKYGGVLLTATVVDGFHHLLPIAFAIVEGETVASWTWFMERVRKMVALQRTGVCVISDRHAGIMSTMKNPNLGWCEPYGYHRFCVRHLAANFVSTFRKSGLKERVVTMCSQLTVDKFNLHWKALLAVKPRADEWFSHIHPEHSALSCDGGKRFGIMTTNMAESWNNAIKEARRLPICALVKALYYKVVSYFDQRRLEIEKQDVHGNEFTKHANKLMNKWKKRATGHHVTKINRDTWVFEVVTMKHGLKGGKKQIVRLQERLCTCNKWQTYQIPCSHVLACCASVGLQHTSFVSEWYKLENAKKVYAGHFEPIPDKKAWPLLRDFPTLIPDDEIPNKPGRRKETRYKNVMDYQSKGKGKGASSSVP